LKTDPGKHVVVSKLPINGEEIVLHGAEFGSPFVRNLTAGFTLKRVMPGISTAAS
jgi:hypothetical protein